MHLRLTTVSTAHSANLLTLRCLIEVRLHRQATIDGRSGSSLLFASGPRYETTSKAMSIICVNVFSRSWEVV